jgi:hypothetical protein
VIHGVVIGAELPEMGVLNRSLLGVHMSLLELSVQDLLEDSRSLPYPVDWAIVRQGLYTDHFVDRALMVFHPREQKTKALLMLIQEL